MTARQITRSKYRWIPFMLLAIALGGCAVVSPKNDLIPMFWPDPPEKTRIQYVRSFRSNDDLESTISISLLDLLAGKEPKKALGHPLGLAVSEDGKRLYAVDFGWNGVVVFDLEAKITRFIGDRPNPLSQPVGVALDGPENVYVADTGSRSVKVYDKNGKFLRGIGKDLLVRPTGIALDKTRRRLYVVDTGHNDRRAHQIKVFDLEGKLIRDIGRRGGGDGEFNFPTFAAVDSEGHLYVADSANARIQVFDPEGKFLRKFGEAGNRIGYFGRPQGVALDSFGNIYVVDTQWSIVQLFNKQGKLLMTFGGRGSYPGLLMNPSAIAIDKENKIYVSNTIAKRVDMYQLVNTTAEDSIEDPKADSNLTGKKTN